MRTRETAAMIFVILRKCRGCQNLWPSSDYQLCASAFVQLTDDRQGFLSKSQMTSHHRHRHVSSCPTATALPISSRNDPYLDGSSVYERPSTDDDIQSFRSLYKFHPLRPGSSRALPPTISEFDFDDEDCEKGEAVYVDVAERKYLSSGNDDVHDVDEVRNVEQTSRKTPNVSSSSVTMEVNAPEKYLSEVTTPTQVFAAIASSPYKGFGVSPSFMEPVKIKAMTSSKQSSNIERKLPTAASNGNSGMSQFDVLSLQLDHLASQIYQLNDGVEFNINSPKQVAQVLFGENDIGDTSTSKDALEALASAGNEVASCIYKYRKISRERKREQRRIEQIEKGDKKNDYYGNLARHDGRKRAESSGKSEAVSEKDDSGSVINGKNGPAIADCHATTEPRRREPLLLIDASAYIFRAYHAIPPLHRSDGTPTGALHGVCRMLQNLLLTRLLKGERPRAVLVFDCKRTNFRHDIYPEYKANRGPCPEDLVPQFDLVRDASTAFGVVQVEAEGYEADDVISTLTRQALNEGVDVDILSGDKDLMQLITPAGVSPSVHMIDPMHFDRVDHDDVVKKWGVGAVQLGDVLALAGDASDNIPGAPGIGPKIAAALINEFGTLSNLIKQADTIKQTKRRQSIIENAEKLLLFRKIVTLDESIPVRKMTLPASFQDVGAFRMAPFDPSKLIDFYKRMELNSCQNQLESRLRSSLNNYKLPPSPEEYKFVPF